jgi:hypothetical protein
MGLHGRFLMGEVFDVGYRVSSVRQNCKPDTQNPKPETHSPVSNQDKCIKIN